MLSKKFKKKFAAVLVVLIGMTCVGSITNNTVKAEEGKVKNVIYLIADGMSDSVLTASRYYKDIQDGVLGNDDLAMDTIRTGYVKTSWANGPITDSAPAGTALSSGYKTNPGVIGMNTESAPKATLLEAAELKGLSTGIIATCEVPHATPGAFSSHVDSRNDYNSIMKQQLHQNMEVVLAGGSSFFEAEGGGKRNDGKDLTKEIEALGYDYVTTKEEMNNSNSDKLWGLFADTAMEYDFDRKALDNTEEPSLKEMTEKAVEVLEKNEEGFFLMVEGSKIDWAAHANDPAGTIGDIIAFDEAVEYAIDYAKENEDTIVVVTTDHANSGFSIGNEDTTSSYDNLTFEDSIKQLKDFSLSAEKFNSLISGKSDVEISELITKYYGYSNITDEEISLAKENKINQVIAARAKIGYTTGGHTGGDVYLGVYSPTGVKKLRGTVDNTKLPEYIASNLGLDLTSSSEQLFGDIKGAVEAENAIFTINKDDEENPYITIDKGGVSLKLNANSNLVEVSYGSGKNETKELPGVLIINKNDEVYGATYEVVNILKDALSKLESSETFGNIDNKDEIEDTSNNEKDNNSSKDDISTDNKKGNTLKTGEVVGIGAVIMLILSASIACVVMYKKKEIE